jgi:hypothetical protein
MNVDRNMPEVCFLARKTHIGMSVSRTSEDIVYFGSIAIPSFLPGKNYDIPD